MKIENCEVMILKVSDPKANSKNEIYYMVDLAVIDGGDQFSIMVKDVELVKKLSPFSKTVVNLDLTNSKYGLNLKIY